MFLTTLDTAGVRNLSRHASLEWGLGWSPGGSRLLFGTDRDGNAEVYVMNADGSDPRNLGNRPARDDGAFWSPDGREIVFTSDRDGGLRELYLMRADGSDVRRLTRNGEYDDAARFSPDGTPIAYTSVRNGQSDIWVVRPDGTAPRQVTSAPHRDEIAEWRPR